MRDENLLESALLSPFQTFGGETLYKNIEMKAARLCYSLIRNHPFVDGNRRIGVLGMLTFLELNYVKLDYTDDDLIRIGLQIAVGEMDAEELSNWIIASRV